MQYLLPLVSHVHVPPSAGHTWLVGQAPATPVQQLSAGMQAPLHSFWLAAAHVQAPPFVGHTWPVGQEFGIAVQQLEAQTPLQFLRRLEAHTQM